MTPPDDLERYETTDAQDLLRLLGTVRPPLEGRVPAAFRAQVLARIAQRQQPWWRRLWLAPAWAPALVCGLLLSVALNVWWGTQAWEPHPQVASPAPGAKFLPQLPESTDTPTQTDTPGDRWFQRRVIPALAGALLLSVALNVWLSYRLWKTRV
jgi:hypothetical protein